ncbi:MAG: zinc ribbon domain-containing protein, partial [Planctomycetota bacterium]
MTTSQPTATGGQILCGKCGTENAKDSHFCSSCGQSLMEQCPDCNQTVSLSQTFCGACGTDLNAKLKAKLKELDGRLSQAKEALENFQFQSAIGLLERSLRGLDYRHAVFTDAAEAVIAHGTEKREEVLAHCDAMKQDAETAVIRGDYQEAIAAIERIPEALRGPEVQKIQDNCTGLISDLERFRAQYKSAVKQADFVVAGIAIDQLLPIVPKEQTDKWQGRAKKIAEQLHRKAMRHLQKGKIDRALEELDAIPGAFRHAKACEELSKSTKMAEWARNQISLETYASPALGYLMVRIQKVSPEFKRMGQLVAQLKEVLATPPQAPVGLPIWRAKENPDYAPLSYPARIKDAAKCCDGKQPGRFHVAIGLAMQALASQGQGTVMVSDGIEGKKQNAFGKLLSRRKADSCWGVDLGTSGVRAVQMQWQDDQFVVTDWFQKDLPSMLQVTSKEQHAAGQ